MSRREHGRTWVSRFGKSIANDSPANKGSEPALKKIVFHQFGIDPFVYRFNHIGADP